MEDRDRIQQEAVAIMFLSRIESDIGYRVRDRSFVLHEVRNDEVFFWLNR